MCVYNCFYATSIPATATFSCICKNKCSISSSERSRDQCSTSSDRIEWRCYSTAQKDEGRSQSIRGIMLRSCRCCLVALSVFVQNDGRSECLVWSCCSKFVECSTSSGCGSQEITRWWQKIRQRTEYYAVSHSNQILGDSSVFSFVGRFSTVTEGRKIFVDHGIFSSL